MTGHDPDPAILLWCQTLPRFAPLREGGPGRPAGLVALAAGLVWLARMGIGTTAARGIDSAGPAMILIAGLGLLTLALWLLLKTVLRPLTAEVRIDDSGVSLRPAAAQAALDRRMQRLTLLAFLVTWKGGQWASFAPRIAWRDLREIRYWPRRREYLLRGGAWDIRLTCPPGLDERLRQRLSALGALDPRAGQGHQPDVAGKGTR